MKALLKSRLKFACIWGSITTDGWTSTTDHYISLSLHFVNEDFKIENIMLALVPFFLKHTGANLRNVISENLALWDINSESIVAIIHDKGSDYVSATNGMDVDSLICSAHILHNCIKDSLKGSKRRKIEENGPIIKVLEKVRTIVSHFRHSTASKLLLDGNVEILGGKKLHLLIDVSTRWNSVYYMVERFLELKTALNMTLSQTTCSVKDFLKDDWLVLEQIAPILKKIKNFTDEIEGDDSYISIVIPRIKLLLQSLEVKAPDEIQSIEIFKKTLREALLFRFDDILKNINFQIATFLDPRLKSWVPSDSTEKILNQLKKDCEFLQKKGFYFDEESVEDIANEEKPLYRKKQDDDELFGDSNESFGLNNDNKEEQMLISQFRLYSIEKKVNKDPLVYWKEKSTIYKFLAPLARKYFSIKPTQAYSERIFSTAEDIVCKKRNRLKPENAEILVFLNKNSSYL